MNESQQELLQWLLTGLGVGAVLYVVQMMWKRWKANWSIASKKVEQGKRNRRGPRK